MMPKDTGFPLKPTDRALPARSPSYTRPLAPLRAGLLTFAAVLAVTGVVLAWTGHLGVVGSGVMVLAILILLALERMTAHRQQHALVFEAANLLKALRHDPAQVFLTDPTGASLSIGAASSALGLEQHLMTLVADPATLIAQLSHEVALRRSATRQLKRGDLAVYITVHAAGPAETLLVWRVVSTRRDVARSSLPDDLPIVQRKGDAITMNKAAHDEIARTPGLLTALSMVDLSAIGPPSLQVLRDGLERARSVLICSDPSDVTVILLLPDQPDRTKGQASSAMDLLPVALLQLNRSGRIVHANATAIKLLDLEQQSPIFLSDLVDDLGRPVSAWLDDAWAGRSVGKPEIVRARLSRGEIFLQIVLQHGSDETLLAVLTDATEHKSLEAKFVQSQKMQAIGQLAGGVAHDFNNLLTAISGHCDLLLLDRPRHDADYDDLLQIYQNTNRAAALVRQLLAYSRKQKLQTEPVDVETLLEDVVHLLTRLVGEKINVKLRHDPELAPIMADPRQLEQVLMNLVVNARDAMPMGGTIEIATRALVLERPRPIGQVTLSAGSYTQIKVIDAGVGMSQEVSDKIFEPFFTTKKTGEGTGLGLSTVYGIVKQMGGYVFVDSVEGAGTTFTLYFASDAALVLPERRDTAEMLLPRPEPTPARRPTRGADAPVLSQPAATDWPEGAPPMATILLVEDETPVRNFAARALRLKGYSVIEARDGEQALAIVAESAHPIDLYVTDVIMPAMDGPAWVAQAVELGHAVPVVFMSGYAEETVNEALKRTPRAVFLSKPFSLDSLLATVAEQVAQPAQQVATVSPSVAAAS